MHSEQKLVSVIIPTFNSDKTIGTCLASIRVQTYRENEIVIVDRFSTDSTVSIARRFGCKVIQSATKRSPARNLGAAEASGDFLMFIDSDMKLQRDVLEKCVTSTLRDKFDSLIVPEISVGMGFWSKCVALEKKMYIENEQIESPCFFTRLCFEGVGGYDDSLEAGEDWDILCRLRLNNQRVGHADSLIFHDEGRVTLSKLFRKKYFYGQSIRLYEKRHPALARSQLSPARFANRNSITAMLRSPLLGLGLVFMKTLEFSALLLGQSS